VSGKPETHGFPWKDSDLEAFVERAWRMGDERRREGLPWRFVDDPYAVYVSEAMLQQTQVARVIKHWPRWMAAFPTIDALAAADPSEVLARWQGLGYNRRALAMKKTAEICAQCYSGAMPRSLDELQALPGIGPATAAGIMAFAYRAPSVYIETNVRAVFIHEFFADAEGTVSDRQLFPLVERTCSVDDPRGWYYALLDYGCYLKQSVVNPSRKSAHYSRQSAFEGSRRQKRAFILREVLGRVNADRDDVKRTLDEAEAAAGRGEVDDALFDSIVADLAAEGFFRCEGSIFKA
jgi:A/G-specific adenine glycosylase